MLSVATFLWDDPTYRWRPYFTYGPEHPRRLFSAVDRHLTLPHEKVLITDMPDEDYGPHVDRIVPMWSDYRKLPGWRSSGYGNWARLKAFDRETGLQIGKRFVWFDLDTVIVGSLDPLLSRQEDFIAWRDVNPPTPYCGSMVMMDAGARQRVWDEFDCNPQAAMKRAAKFIGTDQAWIGACLGPDEARWDGRDGVYNFRHELVKKRNGSLPNNARVVFFTGAVDPSQSKLQSEHPWIAEHWH